MESLLKMHENKLDVMLAIIVLSGAMLTLLWGSIYWMLGFGAAGFLFLMIKDWPQREFTTVPGGLANWLTVFRLIVLFVITACYSEFAPFAFAFVVIAILILDGLDGYVARKRNEMTEFGANIDMETDAFLAACISMVIVLKFHFPVFVLFAGLLRYYFVLLKWIFKLQNLPTPGMKGVKLLAVLYFVSLISPFVLPLSMAIWIVYIGIILVVFSFTREFILLLRLKSAAKN